jgi:hypothetical protein
VSLEFDSNLSTRHSQEVIIISDLFFLPISLTSLYFNGVWLSLLLFLASFDHWNCKRILILYLEQRAVHGPRHFVTCDLSNIYSC